MESRRVNINLPSCLYCFALMLFFKKKKVKQDENVKLWQNQVVVRYVGVDCTNHTFLFS